MNKFFVILTVFILMSCKDSATKPTPFIEEKKMENILYDMALLYSIENVSAYSREDTLKKVNVAAIYKKYDIDSLTFVSNNRYYVELGGGVYNKMQNNILVRLEAAKVIADSLYNKSEVEKESKELNLDALPKLEAEKIDSVQIQKK